MWHLKFIIFVLAAGNPVPIRGGVAVNNLPFPSEMACKHQGDEDEAMIRTQFSSKAQMVGLPVLIDHVQVVCGVDM